MNPYVSAAVITALSLVVLINLRVEWLNRNDRCAPTASTCVKTGSGHRGRHHCAHPVPFHSTCPQ